MSAQKTPEFEFFQACNQSREELARGILKQHPSVNIDMHGAIHWAIVFRREKIVDFLLSLGAKLDTCKLHSSSPLLLAMTHFTSPEMKLKYMRKLLEAGAPVDLGNENGNSPLAQAYDVPTAKLLIKFGANINYISPNNGWSVLMTYCDTQRKELVKLLLLDSRMNTIDHFDKSGYSALIIAVEKELKEIAVLLIEHGADYNSPTPSGRSLFELASPEIEKAMRDAIKRRKITIKDAILKEETIVSPGAVVAATNRSIPPHAMILMDQSTPLVKENEKLGINPSTFNPNFISQQQRKANNRSSIFRFFSSKRSHRHAAETVEVMKQNSEPVMLKPSANQEYTEANSHSPPISSPVSDSLSCPTADVVLIPSTTARTSSTLTITLEDWNTLQERLRKLENKIIEQEAIIKDHKEDIEVLKKAVFK